MAVATAVQGVAGMAGGISKFFEGRQMQRQAQQAIDKFQWQELKNPYKDLQVSTLGSDLQREENARAMSTTTNALQAGGTRAIVGGAGRVVAQNNAVNRNIAANLDQQQKQIDFAGAQDDTQIRQMKEGRQANELAGYGNMLQQGRSLANQGLSEGLNAIGTFGQGMGGMMDNLNAGKSIFGLSKGVAPVNNASVSIPRQTLPNTASTTINAQYMNGGGYSSGLNYGMSGRTDDYNNSIFNID